MKGFLEEVAADLYARYGEGLSDRAVLFPSRRARLFFVDALGRIAGRPMWQPEWVTIDDLTGEISGLHTGDRVRLITELYKVYSAYHNEPFDKFYFWGDMLLTDFDTIDKYLIDAQMLFRNISEIKEIEADISYLTPAQLRILSFWSSFGEQADLSEEKRRFLAIWKTLGPIYRRFRERLSSLGIAYNGMVQRAAADRIRGGGFAFPEPRRYVVAGFNALSECEKRLFGFLATAAETDFYWDYDSYYKDDPEQEAGMFVRSNVAQFPPRTELRHDNMRGEKQVVSVAAVSNAVQCKYAAAILAGIDANVFGLYRVNPEEFIKKVAALIVSEKATMVVEHISYHEIDDVYDEAIFTERMPDNASKAYEAKKNIQRFVFPDSDGERRFAEDMDAAAEVAVYAKLPRTFQIPTPVGNYAPDWAIAFKEGSVRHVFFVAETKGTMDTLELSGVENAKIACAKKLFNEMSTGDVRYHNVATYEDLLEVMGRMG